MPDDGNGDRALPLKEQAYRHLLDLLMSDEVPPGTFISERQLVARLGMSKTPIRVARERLDRDGFVEILPQRGVRLRELTEPEIADYYDFRVALESWVVKRLATAATASDVRELRRIVARQRKLLDRRPRSTTDEHEAIVDAIEAGDPPAAERALVAHLEHGREVMRAAVRDAA